MTARKKRVRRSALRRTAYHEAGHALAAFIFRRRFKKLTIEPEGDFLGRITLRPLDVDAAAAYEMSPSTRVRLEQDIIIKLAGQIAERLVSRRWNHVGASYDHHNAFEHVSRITQSEREVQPYFDWLVARTRALVEGPAYRPMLDALADALLTKRTLTGSEAVAIMHEAIASVGSGAGNPDENGDVR